MGGQTELEVVEFASTVCGATVAIDRPELGCKDVAHQIRVEQRRTRRHGRRLSSLDLDLLLDDVPLRCHRGAPARRPPTDMNSAVGD